MPNRFKEEKTSFIFNYLLPIYIVICIFYLLWRFEIASTWHTWYAWPLVVSEAYSAIISVLYLITARRIMHPIWVPPLRNRTVDVFIPTLNEPEYIIKMTAIGALNICGVRNVYVLDDGKRENIKEMTQKIGAKYLVRPDNFHAKAGNMNFGLENSDAEFIICLDCDHVPQKNFIERTLGYFADENLAFVQTPQTFYNTESIQFRKLSHRNYWNEESMFYESIQPAKNAFNAAFFCGSGAILRRSAIDSVGGFATETATEDLHTSLKLHARGWRSLFLSEQLAHGLAPEDLEEYHKQRIRWGAGSLGLLFRSSDSPLWAKGLTLMQRICYFNSASFFLNGIQKLFYLLLPVIILFSLLLANPLTHVPNLRYLIVFMSFLGFSYLVTYIYSRRTFHPVYTEHFGIASIFSSIIALKALIHVQKKFRVSRKVKVEKQNTFIYYMLFIIWATMFAANIFCIYYWFIYSNRNIKDFLDSLVATALFWNSFNFIFVGSLINFLRNYNNQKSRTHVFKPSSVHSLISYKSADVITRVSGAIESISLIGAHIFCDVALPKEKIEFIIQTEPQNIILSAKVFGCVKLTGNTYKIDIVFDNLPIQAEKQLTLFLFHKVVPEMFLVDFIEKESIVSLVWFKNMFSRLINSTSKFSFRIF